MTYLIYFIHILWPICYSCRFFAWINLVNKITPTVCLYQQVLWSTEHRFRLNKALILWMGIWIKCKTSQFNSFIHSSALQLIRCFYSSYWLFSLFSLSVWREPNTFHSYPFFMYAFPSFYRKHQLSIFFYVFVYPFPTYLSLSLSPPPLSFFMVTTFSFFHVLFLFDKIL